MYFASDTTAPAHPSVIEAIARVNTGYTPSYGADESMQRVTAKIRDLFDAPEAQVYLVSTGTAANALALACFAQPWSAIYCHKLSHIEDDECGAPGFFTDGAKLVLLDGDDGKIAPDLLREKLAVAAGNPVHKVQSGALSLTNVTERGAVYQTAEVAELAGIAKAHGLPVHLDGTRFGNAIAATGATPAEMTWKAGVDVLSFGGTKGGLMAVEAVVLFDPEKAWEFELRRKRAGHLVAKHRFMSAQMEAYLEGDLWLKLAERANRSAARLAAGLQEIGHVTFLHPTEANILFCTWDQSGHDRAIAGGAQYERFALAADAPRTSARLVCSWSTTEDDVDRFLSLVG
jgi:threonine aldolase